MRDADIVRKHKNLVYVQALKFLQTSRPSGAAVRRPPAPGPSRADARRPLAPRDAARTAGAARQA